MVQEGDAALSKYPVVQRLALWCNTFIVLLSWQPLLNYASLFFLFWGGGSVLHSK